MPRKRTFALTVAIVGVLFLTTSIGTVAAQSTGAQDPVDGNGDRIVGGPGGNFGTVFLGEDDIATDKGVFRGVQPGEFEDADSNVLVINNGVVGSNNKISTYIANIGGTTRVLNVREPRVQSLFVIDALENERLDVSDTTIEPSQPGDGFNVQVAADYNYFESTSIDTTTDFLRRDGSDVTGTYIENTQDVSLDPGGPFQSVDEFGRTYDFLANFNINDTGTGEYTVNADPRTGNQRPDGRDVGFADREDATDSLTYTIQQQQQTGDIKVTTANRSESVEAVNSQTGDVEDNGVTNQNGEVDLTVPAGTPVDILVDGTAEATGVSVSAGANTTVDVSGGATPPPIDGLQDPVNADGDRIVGGPSGNSGTIFLGEDDISLTEGVFRGVVPGQFTDADDNVLVISNGIVGPSNAISTYTIDTDGDGVVDRTLNVREPRVQSLFVIDALENERLDGGGVPEINRSGPGDDFNVQIAADYNYFESTSISLDGFLTRGGNDVTGVYFEKSQDTSLEAGGPFQSVDENRRTYDFLANFNITDTGEYTINTAPASGNDRADGRDVGFADRDDATDSGVVRITGDGGTGSIDAIQTSLSDMDGDDLPDQVQVNVTVSNVTSGQTMVELGETNFDVDVSPTDTQDGNQEQLVSETDPDGDGIPESVQFTGIGKVSSATYTVVADLSGQADGDTGTVTVELGGGTTDSATYTLEEATGPLDPNNPFGDSGNNPVDRGTVINRVVEWNLNGEIGGTSYTRSEIINFIVEWNLET